MLLTPTVEAEEGRDAKIIDTPNTLIQTSIEYKEYKEIFYMGGNIYELLMRTSPEIYQKYITFNKKGESVIYVKAINAIYGIMRAEILFYKSLLVI